MRIRIAFGLLLLMLCAAAAHAATLRVVVVETPDAAAYAKALEQLEATLKSKGQQVSIRIWRATYAGSETGAIVVSAEYPSLEALAKSNDLMASDADLKAQLGALDKIRKIVSDSIYTEL
jgi:hypothetical protein